MRKWWKIGRIVLLSLLSLILILVIGLLVYYQAIYKETPAPAVVDISNHLITTPAPSDALILYPLPQKVAWKTGSCTLPAFVSFSAPAQDAQKIKEIITNRLNLNAATSNSGMFSFLRNTALTSEAYTLKIQQGKIVIEYSELPGIFYALTTVKQLAKQSNNQLPCVVIEDHPDLITRGAMLDISRGKVPTPETLYRMIDYLADLKYNHLELYVEGFSFAYPSFKNLWEKTHTPLTPEEIRKLDTYCKARFIDLVPNQNSLGHMDAWLATNEYKDLAECPDGYQFLGLINMKSTLSPSDPKSLALVTKMSDDLLPNFTSTNYNVNLDEPFELGKNKDRPIKDPKEVTKVYLDYATRLNAYVKSKGKKMLIWGDVIARNPEFAQQIPKDITLLEWRYESFQDFDKVCRTYHDAGLNYMVCPGTSTWTNFTGRTDNMLLNVSKAVESAVKHNAAGMVITDWGDAPHLQYLTLSYAGLAWAGALSWNSKSKDEKNLSHYLSKLAFADSTGNMGNIVLALGRYCQFEEYPMLGGTTTGMAYRFGMLDKTMTDAIFEKFQKGIFDLVPAEADERKKIAALFEKPNIYNPKAIIDYVDALEKKLNLVKLHTADSTLILAEYKNSIRMVKLGAMLKQFNNYHLQQPDAENKQLLTEMNSLCNGILNEHQQLWISRNKSGGLEQSTESIRKIQAQVNEQLELQHKNVVTRWFSNTNNKIKTAAAVLYLK